MAWRHKEMKNREEVFFAIGVALLLVAIFTPGLTLLNMIVFIAGAGLIVFNWPF